MNDIIAQITIDALSTVITGKTVGSATGRDPQIDDLNRQLAQARKANHSLRAYLKEIHNLSDEQIAKAQKYRPKATKKAPLNRCSHCGQHVFSRNVATCFSCGGALRAVGSDV